MITARFTYREHEEYGSMGLAYNGRPWADPIGGMGVAHDILEHLPRDDGSTEAELMALGASLLVRDGVAYSHMKGNYRWEPSDNISSDFPQQWHYMQQAGRSTLRDPGVTRRLSCDYAEQQIQDTARKAVALCLSEFDGDLPAFLTPKELPKVIGWMRKGYRAAAKRFRGHDPYSLAWTFKQIEEAAERVMRECEDYGEGTEVLVKVDLDRCSATAEAIQPDYWY